MPSLAELLNAPGDFEYQGKTYQLRQPTLLECGRYQRWLESEARASAAAATDLPEEDRRNLLRDVNADIAAQTYAWGGEVCIRSLRTPQGAAKLLSITAEDQGVSYPLALEMINHRFKELTALMFEADAGDDPKKKAHLGSLLATLGLPADFLSNSSSKSAASKARKRSSHLGVSRSTKSKKSSRRPKGTSTGGSSSRH